MGAVALKIGGGDYSLPDRFVRQHPGGEDILRRLEGVDDATVTQMYRCYHRRLPNSVLDAFRAPGNTAPLPDEGGILYAVLKRNVHLAFRLRGIDPKDPKPGMELFFRTLLPLYVLSIAASWQYSVWWGLASGIVAALIACHTMHDLSHFALSSQPLVWKYGGRMITDFLLGGSIHAWHWQHVIGHHIWTNKAGTDPDIPHTESGDIRRIFAFQKAQTHHIFQTIYLHFLYPLLVMKMRVTDITCGLVQKRQSPQMEIRNVTVSDWVWAITGKAIFLASRLWLPVSVFGTTFPMALASLMLRDLAMGAYLSHIFQISHLSTLCETSQQEEEKEEWAVRQIKRCVDYAPHSKIVTFLVGGLNHQTAHHLFPSVSQYNLPLVTEVIADTLATRDFSKMGVKINCVPSFWQAWLAHWRLLAAMSTITSDSPSTPSTPCTRARKDI
jgi:fatty acid desaturase